MDFKITTAEDKFNQAKATKLAELDTYYKSNAVRKVVVNNVEFLNDSDLRINVLGSLLINATDETTTDVDGIDGTLALSKTQIETMQSDLESLANGNYGVLKAKKTLIDTLSNAEEVEAFEASAGFTMNQVITIE